MFEKEMNGSKHRKSSYLSILYDYFYLVLLWFNGSCCFRDVPCLSDTQSRQKQLARINSHKLKVQSEALGAQFVQSESATKDSMAQRT